MGFTFQRKKNIGFGMRGEEGKNKSLRSVVLGPQNQREREKKTT